MRLGRDVIRNRQVSNRKGRSHYEWPRPHPHHHPKELKMFDISGKNALVTGASGGLGKAIAQALHAQGAKVVLSGTKTEALNALKAELGERSFVATANLSDPAAPAALLK